MCFLPLIWILRVLGVEGFEVKAKGNETRYVLDTILGRISRSNV